MTAPRTDRARTIEALQTLLAAEHAAVHLWAAIGARSASAADPTGSERAGARHAVHRQRRDELSEALRGRGAEPVAAAAAYDLPPLGDPDRALAAGLLVEQRCSEAYAALVARSDGRLRGWAIEALVDSAATAASWGGGPESFPGTPDL